MKRASIAAALGLSCAVAAAQDRGERAFEPCRACHAVEHGAPAAAGPNLAGLMGRPVGGDASFDYSPVLRAAAAAGLRWDDASLERFLADPEAMFPGMWMSARGVDDPAERRALVAYLTRRGSTR